MPYYGCLTSDFPTKDVYAAIEHALKNEPTELFSASKRSKLKKKYFLHVSGGQQRIHSRKTRKPLLTVEQADQVLKVKHDQNGHPGLHTLVKSVKQVYHHIKREFVSNYIKQCSVCASRTNPQRKPAEIIQKPIEVVMRRLHMNLIDMSQNPDGDKRYILNFRDDYSNYQWAYAMDDKHTKNITNHLRRIFCEFGAPRILQSDVGGQFASSDMKQFLQQEFPETTYVFSSFLMQCSNEKMNKKTGDNLMENINSLVEQWKKDKPCTECPWSQHLSKMVAIFNDTLLPKSDKTPFQLMFSRK